MLADTQKALSDKNITMSVSKDTKVFLMHKGTDLKFGARPLRRAIQRYLEDEISERILRSEIKNGENINIDFDKSNNLLTFSVQ